MGSARLSKPGQEIIVIGSALGTLQNSVSRGIVSGLRNSGGATLVQTDAATNPGNQRRADARSQRPRDRHSPPGIRDAKA